MGCLGAILSNEISKIYGAQGLPANTLKINFKGTAGQSFGAFATNGLTLVVNGNTNDYLAKGLSGAKIIVKVPEEATIIPEENIIIGKSWDWTRVPGLLAQPVTAQTTGP